MCPVPDDWVPQARDAARLRVGARPLPPRQWVSAVDDDWASTREMKRALVADRPRDVVAWLPGSEEACEEAAAGVLGSVSAPLSTATGIDALVDAALEVADDLCVLAERDGRLRLVAAVLCSPNRWRLADKIGGTTDEIHEPVARYDVDLSSPVDAMLARLTPERPVWRLNWGLANHPALFQPVAPPVTADIDPARLWFRVEWQTLRRLPVTGAVLFGIRTYLETLESLASRERSLVQDFGDLVAKLPDNVAEYKGIAPYRSTIGEYIERRVAGG
ncbi:MAG: hypothetical protein RLY50_750 [Actinomycetota bacterium]|jgi:hypothetical protein